MTENFISDTSLLGEVSGRVKDLSGFSRSHREPEEHSPRALRFVQIAGTRDVADRAGILFSAIRKTFRYKRKEISLVCDEGGASIETPDFDVTLTLEQDPVEVTNYRLVTEVDHFRRPEIVVTAPFSTLFGPYCDRVAIAFGNPIDLEAKIDLIEENRALADFLDYDSACTWFSLKLPGLLLQVTPSQMVCRLSAGGDLARLIEETQAALERLAGVGAVLDRPVADV